MQKIRMTDKAVKEGMALAEASDDFHIPLSEMSREELIAIAAIAMDAAKKAKDEKRAITKIMLNMATSSFQ